MDLPPELLQFLASLAGVFLLAAIAAWLKLGPAPRLASVAEARAAAEEAMSGFTPVRIALDREGKGALLQDASGRVLLLRPHGSHFVGRILTPAARTEMEGETLVIDTDEKRFGSVRLVLEEASAWVQAINAIKTATDA